MNRIEDDIKGFKEMVDLGGEQVDIVKLKCDNVSEGIEQQKVEMKISEKRLSDMFSSLKSRFDAFTAEIRSNFEKFEKRGMESMSQNLRTQAENFMKSFEGFNSQFNQKLKNDTKEFIKLKKDLAAKVEDCIRNLQQKIRGFEYDFMIKTRLEIDEYKIRKAKELRLMAIEDESRRNKD